ncbi:GSCOCG00012098001-RA-CDS, partial [Cotesia congregata]
NNTLKIIRNIVQGSLWDDRIKRKGNKDIVLPLIAFYDNLETGNPLRSHSRINKLGAVHTSIATVPPNMSSKLENICLTELFYSNDRVTFCNALIFKKLIIDLKELEEVSIEICLNNEILRVKFVLVTLARNNLGLNSILGFPESFNATYFCRTCLITKANSEKDTCEHENLIRKVEYYDKHIKDKNIENKVNLKKILCMERSTKLSCI